MSIANMFENVEGTMDFKFEDQHAAEIGFKYDDRYASELTFNDCSFAGTVDVAIGESKEAYTMWIGDDAMSFTYAGTAPLNDCMMESNEIGMQWPNDVMAAGGYAYDIERPATEEDIRDMMKQLEQVALDPTLTICTAHWVVDGTICPDCKGKGKYVGFTKVEQCEKCHGNGYV